jgi:choline kinase
LWLTREHLTDGFVVLNCDVLFHSQLLHKLLSSPVDDALLIDFVDKQRNQLGDEEMKVKVSDGLITDIRKDMAPADADGENVGMAKFGRQGAQRLIQQMEALIAQGCEREWAPRAFREFAAHYPLHAVSTNNWPWIEIDFPEDYRRAQEEIFPHLDSTIESFC